MRTRRGRAEDSNCSDTRRPRLEIVNPTAADRESVEGDVVDDAVAMRVLTMLHIVEAIVPTADGLISRSARTRIGSRKSDPYATGNFSRRRVVTEEAMRST